jgi:hypothetical protein
MRRPHFMTRPSSRNNLEYYQKRNHQRVLVKLKNGAVKRTNKTNVRARTLFRNML